MLFSKRLRKTEEEILNIRKEDLRLYAVTDKSWLKGHTLYEQVEKALRGGVTCVQFREKNRTVWEVLDEALDLKKLCGQYGVPFLINDNVELAKETGADGVHLGQKDMEVWAARAILGPEKIIGVSARTPEQARAAQEQGADYLGTGALFATGTKKDAQVIGLKQLQEVCRSVSVPVVAIGGITKENVRLLSGSGICGIAVVRSLFAQADITHAAEELYAQAAVWIG